VANLPNATTEDDIRALFSQYGAVQRVRLFSGEPNRIADGLGYLDLSSEEVASAIAGLDGRIFNGSIIRVSDVSGRPGAPRVSKDRPEGTTPGPDDEASRNLRLYQYEVASVEKAAMPDGGKASDWYRYVLSSGRGQVTGLHRGTLEEVTAYAMSCAEDFNLRNATGKSTRTMAYSKKT
jgi:RNA recognition motif-containing protein